MIIYLFHFVANFHIPSIKEQPDGETSFEKILFPYLDAEKADELVAKYNVEGRTKFKCIGKQYHKREVRLKKRECRFYF